MSHPSGKQVKMNGQVANELPDPEVVPRAKRRQFSAAYKRRILEEADACREPGEIGALLRREGLYSSYLTTWRRQRARGDLAPQKRGRKGPDRQSREMARLQRENERLRAQLERAEAIIEVQKKVSTLFGPPHSRDQEGRAGMIAAAEELAQQVGLQAACQQLQVPRSAVYRARQPQPEPSPRPKPTRALSGSERGPGPSGAQQRALPGLFPPPGLRQLA